MSDAKDKLREAAAAAKALGEATIIANPQAVTELLDESDALRARVERLEGILMPFLDYFIRAESDAGYLIANEDETGLSDIRDALIAVVFNESDAEGFLSMVGRAVHVRDAMEAGGTDA